MKRGYVKLFRKLQENQIWTSEPFTRGQAWVDLIMLANHRDGHIRVRGNRVDVKRGQVGWSESALAKRWKWSRGKVRRYLRELEEKEGQIEQQKNYLTSLILIVNYEQYQGDGTTDGQQTVQQTDSGRYTNKKGKKVKKGKNIEPAPPRQPPAVFSSDQKSRHFQFQVGEWFESIKKTCVELELLASQNGKRFNPYQWVQQKANQRGHPGAIDASLSGLKKLWNVVESPWGYVETIYKTVNGNWNEKDAIRIHEELKALKPGALSEFTSGILKEI